MTTEVPGYVSKTDLVAALIRELVITGELAPAEQLRQRDLAQRFGVSQTPVREAMRRLESEGLLVCDTHRGFTVVAPDVGRVEENFQIRAALESLGAALAARKIDPGGLDRLRELNDQMRALADDDPGYAGAEPGVPLHRVRVRAQPAAAVADAAALGLAARRPPGVAHARRVRPPARRNPGRAGRRRRRCRLGSDISAHHGGGSGKRSIRERAAARRREPPCQRS